MSGNQHIIELLKGARHASMATVNADGSPHNSPFFFAYNSDLTKIFWRSRPETEHAKNITRTGQLFIVLYEAAEHATGLYVRAHNGRVAKSAEFDEAIAHLTLRANAQVMRFLRKKITEKRYLNYL